MTDNEIIKDLEEVVGMRILAKKSHKTDTGLLISILDLIKRQRAEIERLSDYNANLQTANTELSNEILEIKSEAIKEFAEKLKEKAYKGFWQEDCYVDVVEIDDLVKEMTEGEK